MQQRSFRLAAMTVSQRCNNITSVLVTPSASSKASSLYSWQKKQAPRNVRIMSSSSSAAAVMDMENKKHHYQGALPSWPQALVESHGDYRAEAFLEENIGGPLYEHQSSLPRLPIPSVKDTLERFLPTALPLAKNVEEEQALQKACEDFLQDSQELQVRLLNRKEGEMKDSSWLQHWWNTTGYLQVRDPIVVNVSYFFHFSDDGSLPLGKPLNVTRGASMLFAAAEYRKLVCSGQLKCEAIGKKNKKKYLCSTAFKYMFHACRVPLPEQDVYKMYDPSLYTHCIVARHGQFFSMELVDPMTADPLPLEVLEQSLTTVIDMADYNNLEKKQPKLAWLTSSNRDDWAHARAELLRVGGLEMEQALEKLESGALLLCLDDEDPVSRKHCGELFWHGGVVSGVNRWFDKSIQLFCTNNGKAGLQGEHSMMDGMPVVGLANHITATSYVNAKERSKSMQQNYGGNVQDIFGNVSPTLQQDAVVNQVVDKARNDFIKLVTDHELDVESFQGYGSNFIKKAGFSPDAYVQMAMQVATFRLFGEQVGTYEATQMRPFLHGRTETTRSVSTASHAFCEAMGPRPKRDEHVESIRKEKLALLRDAVDAHVQYIGNAAKGKGVDRHFLGLSMLVQPDETAPALFTDPLFQRSKRWRVSTSHLTHPKFENWGYGEVVPDGVGLAYAIKADCCVFNVTALAEHQWTDRLSHLLEEALLEMRDLIEADTPPMSKL